MRTIRASEIGSFLYCQRAWWYQIQGKPSENQADLASGTEIHSRHGQAVFTTGCLRILAYGVLLLGLALLVYALTLQFL
jgi:CRISPR/Cas system-associated exonuclease Cas4 (RecB family)